MRKFVTCCRSSPFYSVLVLLALNLALPSLQITAQVFPSDRLVPWQGNVGVKNGISARTNVAKIRNCVDVDGVPKDNGASDATAKIRTCLTNTPSDGVAYLPAGIYKITGTITIPSNKTLRGAGHTTILRNDANLSSVVYIGTGSSSSTALAINSGSTRGSQSLVLGSLGTVAENDYLLINELNDPTIPVSSDSYAAGSNCTWCDQFGATRLRAQVVKVSGPPVVSTKTVPISPAMYFNFSRTPQARKLKTPAEYVGLEDLTVLNGPTVGTSAKNNNIMIEGAANSWVKNVKVERCGKRCIDLRTYFYRIEIRGNLITECLDHDNSDSCYGTEVAEGSTSLVEDNIYYRVSSGPLLMWGASGNVVSYNYAKEVFRYRNHDSWFWPTAWTHGAHPSYNLWEGNEMAALNWDGYWGSASHNTAFRNRFTSYDSGAGLIAPTEVAAIIIEEKNRYNSVVGNVLGLVGNVANFTPWSSKYEELKTRNWGSRAIYGTGTSCVGTGCDGSFDQAAFDTLFRHRNYDYFTKTVKNCGTSGEPACQGSNASTTLDSSLYLSAKPAWFGNVCWPAIDPVGPVVLDIPAKQRLNGIAFPYTGNCPPSSSGSPPSAPGRLSAQP